MTKRILVIDDDRDMLEMLNIIFQSSDIEVVLSEKGMTGEEVNVVHPDLILLDIQLKGYLSTGDEICKEIKAHPGLKNVPVFLISSEVNLDRLAIECKADGFLYKPLDILKLKGIIRERLE